MNVRIDATAAGRVGRALAYAGDDWQTVGLEAVRECTLAIEAQAKENIRESDLVFRGVLLNSVEAVAGIRAVGRDEDGIVGSVHSELPYASVMEYGRRPGERPPPTEALMPWVRRKLLGRGLKDKKKSEAAETRALAYVVARSIGRKGIKGRRWLGRAVDKYAPRLPQFVEAALRRWRLRLEGRA